MFSKQRFCLREAILCLALASFLATLHSGAEATESIDIYLIANTNSDITQALADSIAKANAQNKAGSSACIFLPSGKFYVSRAMPEFYRDGCIKGEGASKTIILLSKEFSGDLFSWSEAWAPTKPGPRVTGISIVGDRSSRLQQNALAFYDRVDRVYIEDIEIENLPGAAVFFGKMKHALQAYVRESHFRSIRLFNDGIEGVPVFEISSDGSGQMDASNEIRISEMDIFAPKSTAVAIRNNSAGVIRAISFNHLRIEGEQNANVQADLLVIGDAKMTGGVNTIRFAGLELIDPYSKYAAMRITTPVGSTIPYHIEVDGFIGGGLAHGSGLVIDACRSSRFHFSEIHTEGPSVIVGDRSTNVILDGDGAEQSSWTYEGNQAAISRLFFPVLKKKSEFL